MRIELQKGLVFYADKHDCWINRETPSKDNPNVTTIDNVSGYHGDVYNTLKRFVTKDLGSKRDVSNMRQIVEAIDEQNELLKEIVPQLTEALKDLKKKGKGWSK